MKFTILTARDQQDQKEKPEDDVITCVKLNGHWISAAIDYHVTRCWRLVSVSARRVSLGYQLGQSQLTHVDRSRFRFKGDQ